MVVVLTHVRMVVHAHRVPMTAVGSPANVNYVITNRHVLHVSIALHQLLL